MTTPLATFVADYFGIDNDRVTAADIDQCSDELIDEIRSDGLDNPRQALDRLNALPQSLLIDEDRIQTSRALLNQIYLRQAFIFTVTARTEVKEECEVCVDRAYMTARQIDDHGLMARCRGKQRHIANLKAKQDDPQRRKLCRFHEARREMHEARLDVIEKRIRRRARSRSSDTPRRRPTGTAQTRPAGQLFSFQDMASEAAKSQTATR